MVALAAGLAGGLVVLGTPSPGTAAPASVADGALAVAGPSIVDPDAGSGAAALLGPGLGIDPAWSPDGGRLVTVRDVTSRDIWVTDLDGDVAALEAPASFERLNGTAWLDSDTLVMVNGDGTVWTMEDDGTGATQVYDLRDLFPADGFTFVRLEGSRGGRLVIAHRTSTTYDELLLLDLDTDNVTTLVPASAERYVSDAALRPGSGTVTYLSGQRLHDVPVTGGPSSDLLPDLPVVAFDWSPDGHSLAYIDPATRGVRVRDLDTADEHEATWAHSTEVSWQPVGDCTVVGTDGPDTLAGTPGDDVICAGSGDDVVTSSAGRDVVIGGPGQDRIDYSASPQAVSFDGRWLVGRSAGRSEVLSVERVTGSSLADVIRGTAGSDRLQGGPGDDVLHPGSWGGNELDGGPGLDTLELTRSPGGLPPIAFGGGLQVDLRAGTITRDLPLTDPPDTLSGLENVTSSDGAATSIRGDDGPNVLDGGGALTTLEGRGGADTLRGGGIASYASAPGPVTVDVTGHTSSGAAGADALSGTDWFVEGSEYADEITARGASGAGGDDAFHATSDYYLRFTGGPGEDVLDLDLLDHGATLSPSQDAIGVETVRLTRYADRVDGRPFGLIGANTHIFAGAGDDRIHLSSEPIDGLGVDGGPGDDLIVDGGGDDLLRGGSGDDLIRLGPGDDTASGGRGLDLLRFLAFPGPVRVDLAAGTATGSDFGTDLVSGFDDVRGTSGDDVLLGSDGSDVLRGADGSDVLRGRGGDDLLITRDGERDEAYGGAGRDTCVRDRYDRVLGCP